jgi:hypothetical protein
VEAHYRNQTALASKKVYDAELLCPEIQAAHGQLVERRDAGLKRLLKKSISALLRPSAAKAVEANKLSARLKPRPFKEAAVARIFPRPVKFRFDISRPYGTCPFF